MHWRLTVHTRTAQLLVNPVDGAAAGADEGLAAERARRQQRAAAVRLRAHRSIAAPPASQGRLCSTPRRGVPESERGLSFALPPHISPISLSSVRDRLDYCTLLSHSTAVERTRVHALSPLRPHLRRLSAPTRTSPSAYARRARRTLATVKLQSAYRATGPPPLMNVMRPPPVQPHVGESRWGSNEHAMQHQQPQLATSPSGSGSTDHMSPGKGSKGAPHPRPLRSSRQASPRHSTICTRR